MAPSKNASPPTVVAAAFLPRSTSKKFPFKCHEMLSYAEKNNLEHIVSWLPGGKGFQIHDQQAFCKQVLKPTFNHSNFKSFEKQLNNWSFTKENTTKENAKAYSNPNFQRGRKSLCQSMTSKSTRTKKPTSSGKSDGFVATANNTIMTPGLAAAMANEEAAARAQQLAAAAASAGLPSLTPLAPTAASSLGLNINTMDAASKAAVVAALQQQVVAGSSGAQNVALVRALVRQSALDRLKLQQQFQRQQHALLLEQQKLEVEQQNQHKANVQKLLLAAHQRQQQQSQPPAKQEPSSAMVSPSPSAALLQLVAEREEQKERAAALLSLRGGAPAVKPENM